MNPKRALNGGVPHCPLFEVVRTGQIPDATAASDPLRPASTMASCLGDILVLPCPGNHLVAQARAAREFISRPSRRLGGRGIDHPYRRGKLFVGR